MVSGFKLVKKRLCVFAGEEETARFENSSDEVPKDMEEDTGKAVLKEIINEFGETD